MRTIGLIILVGLPMAAQTSRITGQVVDPTGASIPGAEVAITNTGTGIRTPTSTNAEGYYTAPLLDPGYYSITVVRSGFKTAERSSIKLDVAQIARIDFQLLVREQTEIVNITSEAPLIQSESVVIGQVMGGDSVLDLPLNGRNFTQLTTLTPGAFLGGVTGFVRGSTVTANGMRASNTVFVINGINVTDQDFTGTSILPAPDAIQEFKVQTNSLGAQNGLGGMVISVDLKSGTNAFHGVLYEFIRNDLLDARNFFSPTTPALKQNQFGAALGGPIRRDRTFFFADYSGTRIRSGQTSNSVVATASMRQGDFSGLRAINDPASGQPFPNSQIPANRLSPQAAYFLPYFPLPNTPQGTYVQTAASRNDNNQFDVRIDHRLTNSGLLKFTYMFLQPTVYVPGAFPENGGVASDLRHQSAGISEVHTITPNIVNEITLGYVRIRSFGAQQGLGTNHTVQSGIGGFDVTSGTYPGFPGLTPSGFAGLNGNNFQPLRFRENNYNVRDLLSITRGKHTIDAGIDLTRHANFTTNSARSRGNFTFTGTYTGNAFADFLLGTPFQGERSFPRDLFGYYWTVVEPFIQDSWKVTPRLTLNMGLRYSLFRRPTAVHNVLSLFLHFFRTGDLLSLRTAVEAAAHLADVDISHYDVQPTLHGAPRTGPGLNHWTRYSNGEFTASATWAFYKNESLVDRYLLTGDPWSRDVARLSADVGVSNNGLDIQSNTRSIGHGLFAMMKAYEVFGDKKYLDRANWIIDCVQTWQDGDVKKLRELNCGVHWDPQFRGGYSHQSWMYGIALEAMAQASWTFHRPEMPAYLRRAADCVFANPKEWDRQRRTFLNAPVHSVMLTPGLAYIAETSGEKKYWDIALESFRRQTEEAQVTDRLKLFGQLYRNSQRFPWYLSVEAGRR